ncbi:MAG: phosphopyruvate hydratase [Planctomycetota bacterium]
MARITQVHAREVLDSRGRPTVEVEAWSDRICRRAIVPSGASTGSHEACELRDGDANWYDGRGVQQAVRHVNEVLAPAIRGFHVDDQQTIDRLLIELDGSPQKMRLGANALLGVSLATAHLAAACREQPLYRLFHDLLQQVAASFGESASSGESVGDHGQVASSSPASPSGILDWSSLVREPRMPLPMTNMISGGLHAGGNIDFQDVLVMPIGATSYRLQLEWLVRIYQRLGALLTSAGYEGRLVGDEGGYGPRLPGNREAVEFVVRAIEAAGLQPGTDVTIALDVASTHFYDQGTYRLAAEKNIQLTSSQMIDRLEAWTRQFPITSLEDGLAENDWEGWQELTTRLGDRVRLVGDDLFTTDRHRVARGIEQGVGNSVLIKINQIGTLTETLETICIARRAGYTCVVSARSGETEDHTIADLAVGTASEMIKIGSIVRSERLAKYNQLLRIAEELEIRS